jgi:hypothetical protein
LKGESKLLEQLYQRGIEGEEIAPGLYRQPGLLLYWTHDPVAPWQNSRWLEQMRKQHRPNAFLRQIENRWVSNESAFVPVEEWDEIVDGDLRPVLSDPDCEVYVGLDLSTRSDFTALVAVTFDERLNKIRIVDHRLFRPAKGRDVDYSLVEEEILKLNQRFDLRLVSFDPFQGEYLAQRLRAASVPMDHFHQTPDRQTQAAGNLLNLISQRNIVAYPSHELRDAVANSRIIESTKGFRLAKITGARKIDLIVALSFACVVALKERRGEPAIITYYGQRVAEMRAAESRLLGAQPLPPAEALRMEETRDDGESDLYEEYVEGVYGPGSCAHCHLKIQPGEPYKDCLSYHLHLRCSEQRRRAGIWES